MQIPKHVELAVDALLEPYGISLGDLLDGRDRVADTRKRWMTIAEAEHYSGLSRWALWDAARKGFFRQSKLGNARKSTVLIDKKSFDQWLDGHCG